MKREESNLSRGQSLVELLIALGVFVTTVSAVIFVLLSSYISNLRSGENYRALFLAEEGLEAVRSIRNNDWNDLVAGSYGLAVSGSDWIFSGSQEDISSKLKEGARQVIIENIDSDRKKITSKITWKSPQNLPREISLISRLTGWENPAKWSDSAKEAVINLSGSQNGLRIQTQGNYVYLVRKGGSPDFIIIDIADTQNPFIAGSLNLPGNPQDIAVSGNYAYVASDNDDQELQIINISNPSSLGVIGLFNAPGSANGNGIYFNGSKVYLARGSSSQNEFLAVDVFSPSLPVLVGSLNLGATGNDIVVSGNYAYIASGLNSQELQIIDITVPIQPTLAGFYNLSGSSDGLSIAGFGTKVILGRANGLIYLFDAGNPNAPVFLGSFDAGGAVNDITLGNDNNYAFLATDSNNAEFQTVDISTAALPILIGSFNFSPSSNINGIAYNGTKDRIFIASESDNEEFIILAP